MTEEKSDGKKLTELLFLKNSGIFNNNVGDIEDIPAEKHNAAMRLGIKFSPDIIVYSSAPESQAIAKIIAGFSEQNTTLVEESRLSFDHYSDSFSSDFIESLKGFSEREQTSRIIKHSAAIQISTTELMLIVSLIRQPNNGQKKILLLSQAGLIEALEARILKISDLEGLNGPAGYLEGLRFFIKDDDLFVQVRQCDLTFLLPIL